MAENPLKNGAKILLKDAIDFHATGKSSSKSAFFFRIVFNPTFKNTQYTSDTCSAYYNLESPQFIFEIGLLQNTGRNTLKSSSL